MAYFVWDFVSPFLSGRGGGSSITSTGSHSRILALQCSLIFTAKKICPIHDSQWNNGSTELVPESLEDDKVVESNVIPQSCPLTIVKPISETSPNKSADTPQKSTPKTTAGQDGNESWSSRTSGRSKKQKQFYGSPIRHAVKEVSDASVSGFFRWDKGSSVGRGAFIISVSRKENESVQKGH